MKKIITLLCISIFTLVACSSEDIPVTVTVTVPSATAAQAVLDGGSINVTWSAVTGAGITYNIYRNDNLVKINKAPLTEPKFTDVLTATGSYTYTITVNLSGQESPKGIASGKVVLDLAKTITYEGYSYSTNNGTTTTTIYKDFSVLTYDSANITKLISVSITGTNTVNTTVSKSKEIYTYSGNLITKEETVDGDGVVKYSTIYTYNDKNKITSRTFTSGNGYVYKSVYDYNTDGTVSSTEYSTSVSGVIVATGDTHVYTFLNGNLVKDASTYTSPGYNSTSTKAYVFDTKDAPSKYVLGFSNLLGESANLNNTISSVYTSSSSEKYTERNEFTYDANGNVLTEKVFRKQDNLPEKLSSTATFTY